MSGMGRPSARRFWLWCICVTVAAAALGAGLIALRAPRLGIYEDPCFDPEPAATGRQFMLTTLLCTCTEREDDDQEARKERRTRRESLRRDQRELRAAIEALERKRATLDVARDS